MPRVPLDDACAACRRLSSRAGPPPPCCLPLSLLSPPLCRLLHSVSRARRALLSAPWPWHLARVRAHLCLCRSLLLPTLPPPSGVLLAVFSTDSSPQSVPLLHVMPFAALSPPGGRSHNSCHQGGRPPAILSRPPPSPSSSSPAPPPGRPLPPSPSKGPHARRGAENAGSRRAAKQPAAVAARSPAPRAAPGERAGGVAPLP